MIRPELQALRDDDRPQRQAQADLGQIHAAWRDSRLGSGLNHSLAAFASGEALENLPPLARLFAPGDGAAPRLAADFIGKFTGVLSANPWGQVPIPSKLDDVTATIVLAAAGNAALVLQAIDGEALRARPPAVSTGFSPGETHDHVLAGRGSGRLFELLAENKGGAELRCTPCELSAGSITRRDGARQALLIESAETTLVVLRLQRRPACGTVSREFRLADGSLAHQATANPKESRFELAAALLGRMGRSDAAPLLAAMAEERGGLSLRWQALKEGLGLDTAEGFAVLSRIASRDYDELAAPARALRAQLIAAHPQLGRLG
ncbi:MAG: hypothetical protein ACKOQM_09690 [Novosphingobium sp.]